MRRNDSSFTRYPTWALVMLLSLTAAPLHSATPTEVFDQVVALVEERFYDPDLNGLHWQREAAAVRPRIQGADPELLAQEINILLARLEASHTEFLIREDPRWYQLVGVFVDGWAPLREALDPYLDDGVPAFAGIGTLLHEENGEHFVSGLLNGFPAEAAGLKVGDRLVSVDGDPFHPFHSYATKVDREVTVTVERSPGSFQQIPVTPILIDGRNMFETAMRHSIRTIKRDKRRIGYIRAWSYAGRRYQDTLTRSLIGGELQDADALILDIRGGWGGADPSYLNFFQKNSIVASSITRTGETNHFTSGWSRPVVLLTDSGSRSGKELLAYGFRKLEKGTIVGERTGGAVLAGQINALDDGSVLYLAVADVQIDGNRLEGIGVAPDITVPFDVRYAGGADPQLKSAIDEALRLIQVD